MKSFVAGMAWLALTAGVSSAQAPQRTTATYDDWTVRCEYRPETPTQKSCEMVQTAQLQGQANPVTQIAIGRAAKSEPLKVVFQVPIDVWLPAGVKLVYGDKEPPLAAPYKRCLPAACFAESEVKDDFIRKLRVLTENGKLEFKDATQREIGIPFSFKGLGQAFDAMIKD
jgi:invasion protein IalB